MHTCVYKRIIVSSVWSVEIAYTCVGCLGRFLVWYWCLDNMRQGLSVSRRSVSSDYHPQFSIHVCTLILIFFLSLESVAHYYLVFLVIWFMNNIIITYYVLLHVIIHFIMHICIKISKAKKCTSKFLTFCNILWLIIQP